MSRITGYRCDAEKCSNVAEQENLPIGWMTLTVTVDPKADRNSDTNLFHVCSNQCLKRLGTARYKAAVERGDERNSFIERRMKTEAKTAADNGE